MQNQKVAQNRFSVLTIESEWESDYTLVAKIPDDRSLADQYQLTDAWFGCIIEAAASLEGITVDDLIDTYEYIELPYGLVSGTMHEDKEQIEAGLDQSDAEIFVVGQ